MSGLVVILIAVVALVAVFGVVLSVFHFGARTTRGGVEPPPDSRRRGTPPFEGVERDAPG